MKLVELWRRALLELRAIILLKQASHQATLFKLLKARISAGIAKARRRAMTAQFRLVEMLFGPSAAADFFWRSPTTRKLWGDVELRADRLAKRSQDAVDHFTRLGFMKTQDPMVLICLARNVHCRAGLAQCLRTADLSEGSRLDQTIRGSMSYAAAFVGAAGLLLDDASAKRIADLVLDKHVRLDLQFHQIIDSLGSHLTVPPTDSSLRGLLESGMRKPCKHRLIIADELSDRPAIAQLFTGAEKITVIGLRDTFGKTDFQEYTDYAGDAEITVEHIRSRITRFSRPYLDLHEATRIAAERITDGLLEENGLLDEHNRASVELEISDHLFFGNLRTEAVRTLLESEEFDHIVVACQAKSSNGMFLQNLSAVDPLLKDPRVEFISIARSLHARTIFTNNLEAMLQPPREMPTAMLWGPSPSKFIADSDARASVAARRAAGFPKSGTKRILILTANNPAYNAATADYAVTLAAEYDVTIGLAGRDARPILSAITAIGKEAPNVNVVLLPNVDRQLPQLNKHLRRHLLSLAAEPGNLALAHFIRVNAHQTAEQVIAPALLQHKVFDAWFSRLSADEELPDLIVLAPPRNPRVAAFARLARRHGIPSLSLEAHGLNGNYCRYINIDTDFYGVISGYFKKTAERGFNIPLERTFVVGSPRIKAPEDHDLASARAAARELLRDTFDIDCSAYKSCISFFCQPSSWAHVKLVWSNILNACAVLDVLILLKPHPEETPSRVAAYLRLAKEFGMTERVIVVETDPKTAIVASDMMLTGYSTAAIEAAVLGVPVTCVTDGDADYPVDQHEIVNCQFVRSSEALRSIIIELTENPQAYAARSQRFLANEPQFVEGPDRNLKSLVAHIFSLPPEEALREEKTLSRSLFPKGPHQTFSI
ncbi:hypothetical protein SAMN05216452_3356 [Nitratireductor aquibiodomus]|uniref:CDP-Glycerol:Poly(Glycerophosphate) glycerophosphotransferase n=1 Tax=Nitratireductor aquibiodomus TaxID=204799 RepID=A0A1H4MK00_9HYPH|nr:hypothetical protein [Nitratireductor aquibiodomus]SEB83420.1 hypothetical protein SAMN05216452_3356 [Nitratireductor aquibiodomus]